MPPAVSERQRRWMALCAESPFKSRKKCPPKSVAKEFASRPKGGYKKGH